MLVRGRIPHLEGGGFSAGSTCGVVSGGCQSLALRHMDDLKAADPRKMAAFHSLLKEYTTWFEGTYGSTICRERTGCELDTLTGLNLYVLGGRFGRCIVHAGGAARFLAYLEDRPLGEEDPGEVTEPDHCAVEVLRRLRDTTGAGDDFFDALYIAMNGGVGLSGGLCGAAAAGYLPIGWKHGLEIRNASGSRGTWRVSGAATSISTEAERGTNCGRWDAASSRTGGRSSAPGLAGTSPAGTSTATGTSRPTCGTPTSAGRSRSSPSPRPPNCCARSPGRKPAERVARSSPGRQPRDPATL